MNTQKSGTINEQRCLLKCIEAGYVVSKPLFNNARYDFIIDTNGKLLRIQAKSGRWGNDEHSIIKFNGYSQHATCNGNKRMKYTTREIDFFMVQKDNVFYLYPATDEGFCEKSLRVSPTKGNRKYDVEYAEDFLFETKIKSV